MKLFQSKSKRLSKEDEALLYEGREIRTLEKLRRDKELELKSFIEKIDNDSKNIEHLFEEAKADALKRTSGLKQEIGELEKKKAELEESTDEKEYKRRRGLFYETEQKIQDKKTMLDSELVLVADKKEQMADSIESLAKEWEDLENSKEGFKTLRASRMRELDTRAEEISSSEERIVQQLKENEKKSTILDKNQREIYERELVANGKIEEVKNMKANLAKKSRGLKDGYRELEKARDEILGK